MTPSAGFRNVKKIVYIDSLLYFWQPLPMPGPDIRRLRYQPPNC